MFLQDCYPRCFDSCSTFLTPCVWKGHFQSRIRVHECVIHLGALQNCRAVFPWSPTATWTLDSGGSPVTLIQVCLLSVNILNQKILCCPVPPYLIIVYALKVLYDLFWSSSGREIPQIRNQAASLPPSTCSPDLALRVWDFTLLMLIAKNIDEAQFETLLTLYSDSIATGNDTSYPSSLISYMSALHSTEKRTWSTDPMPSYPENALMN